MSRPAIETFLVLVTVVGLVALVCIEGILCRVGLPTPGAVEEFYQSELWLWDWRAQPNYWQIEGHAVWIVCVEMMSH